MQVESVHKNVLDYMDVAGLAVKAGSTDAITTKKKGTVDDSADKESSKNPPSSKKKKKAKKEMKEESLKTEGELGVVQTEKIEADAASVKKKGTADKVSKRKLFAVDENADKVSSKNPPSSKKKKKAEKEMKEESLKTEAELGVVQTEKIEADAASATPKTKKSKLSKSSSKKIKMKKEEAG